MILDNNSWDEYNFGQLIEAIGAQIKNYTSFRILNHIVPLYHNPKKELRKVYLQLKIMLYS